MWWLITATALAHCFSDYFMQNMWMRRGKKDADNATRSGIIATHAFLYTALMLIAWAAFTPFSLASKAAIGVGLWTWLTHWGVDTITSWIDGEIEAAPDYLDDSAEETKEGEERRFAHRVNLHGVDQALHWACLSPVLNYIWSLY